MKIHFVDMFNAIIKCIIHTNTLPDGVDYVINSQIYNAIEQLKWFQTPGPPPTTMHNLLIFYKTVVQWDIEQSNAIVLKAAKKAEKDVTEAMECADNKFDSKRKYIKLEQETRHQHATATDLTTPTLNSNTTMN